MSVLCKYDVFISYSRKDYVDEHKNIIPNNEVSKIKKALDTNGISYWIDEKGIFSGQNFTEIIVENIELSRIFIFLSTENSNASKWTSKEIATADEFGKHIIPVRIDKTPYNKSVMFRIADLDFIEYYQIGSNAGINKLISAVNRALDEIKKREEIEKEKKRKAEIEEKKEEIKAEIRLLEEDLYNQLQKENLLLAQITEKKELIEENNITCPICSTRTKYGERFCHTCGWTFNSVEKLLSGVERNEERKRINTAKAQWNQKERLCQEMRIQNSNTDKITELEQAYIQSQDENAILKKKLRETEESRILFDKKAKDASKRLQEKSQLVNSWEKKVQLLEKNIHSITEELSFTKKRLAESEHRAHVQATAADNIISSLKSKIQQLEKEIENKTVEINKMVEKTNLHDVFLESCGYNKLVVVKCIKETLGIGLKEAKNLADAAPCRIVKGIDIRLANDIKFLLQQSGAVVRIE